MKLSLFLVLSSVFAQLTPVAAEANDSDCPFYDLGAKVDAHFNPTKCKGNIRSVMTKFLETHLTQLFGITNTGDSIELAFPQVCENTGDYDDGKGNNLRRNRRGLQWNFSYNILGQCRFCDPDDDDSRLLLEETMGHAGRPIAELNGDIVSEVEDLLSTMLTDEAKLEFAMDEGSCLFGENIEIAVRLEEASATDCSN